MRPLLVLNGRRVRDRTVLSSEIASVGWSGVYEREHESWSRRREENCR